MWQILQWAGAVYVTQVINEAQGMNKTFALVLGLIAFIYLAAVMGVLGIEINVVLVRRLWPRALLTPFTDAVDLTDADRRAYASYALMNRHKGFETVAVTFDGRDGDTHEIVMDPSWARKSRRSRRRPEPEPDPEPDLPGPHQVGHPRDRL
jgi:membrane protein